MHLSACFKEFLPKSNLPGTREQGGVEDFCKPSCLGMSSAKPQSSRAAPSLFSSGFFFPCKAQTGWTCRKKEWTGFYFNGQEYINKWMMNRRHSQVSKWCLVQ